MRKSGVLVAVAALAVAGACSDTTSPAAAPDALDVVAVPAANATAEDVDVMFGIDASLPGGMGGTGTLTGMAPAGACRFGAECAYDAASGRFVCPVGTHNGVTMTRSFAFFDQAGAPMSAFDTVLTSSANFRGSVTGVRAMMANVDTIDAERDYTVTGLLGKETSRTWNGTGNRESGGTRTTMDGRVVKYHVVDTVVTSNVVVNLPRYTNPWPMSGTVTRHVVGSGTVTVNGETTPFSFDRVVVVTFNGTRYVPMQIGGETFTLDLYAAAQRRERRR